MEIRFAHPVVGYEVIFLKPDDVWEECLVAGYAGEPGRILLLAIPAARFAEVVGGLLEAGREKFPWLTLPS